MALSGTGREECPPGLVASRKNWRWAFSAARTLWAELGVDQITTVVRQPLGTIEAHGTD